MGGGDVGVDGGAVGSGRGAVLHGRGGIGDFRHVAYTARRSGTCANFCGRVEVRSLACGRKSLEVSEVTWAYLLRLTSCDNDEVLNIQVLGVQENEQAGALGSFYSRSRRLKEGDWGSDRDERESSRRGFLLFSGFFCGFSGVIRSAGDRGGEKLWDVVGEAVGVSTARRANAFIKCEEDFCAHRRPRRASPIRSALSLAVNERRCLLVRGGSNEGLKVKWRQTGQGTAMSCLAGSTVLQKVRICDCRDLGMWWL